MTKYAALLLLAQTLNPTVEVLPRPAGPVPAYCEDGLAPAPAARIVVSEIPEPERAVDAPPSSRLRSQLRAVHEAAARNDRAGFRAALSDVRATIAAHPAGRERDEAAAAVRIYEDIDRVWTWQQTSPTGAFFEESDLAGRYPDYERSVADATLVTGGRRLYPSRETREFLVREAQRKLGVTTPRAERRRETTRIAQQRETPRPRQRQRMERQAPSPVVAPQAPSAPGQAGAPVPPSPPVTETAVAPAPMPPPNTTTTTTTTAVAETQPPVTATQPVAPGPNRRNILLPTIIVIAAIGFLIFLFRATR